MCCAPSGLTTKLNPNHRTYCGWCASTALDETRHGEGVSMSWKGREGNTSNPLLHKGRRRRTSAQSAVPLSPDPSQRPTSTARLQYPCPRPDSSCQTQVTLRFADVVRQIIVPKRFHLLLIPSGLAAVMPRFLIKLKLRPQVRRGRPRCSASRVPITLAVAAQTRPDSEVYPKLCLTKLSLLSHSFSHKQSFPPPSSQQKL